MRINEKENGLKGQYNLAQGNALGWKADRKIVRAITFIKEKIFFRTREMTLCFPEKYVFALALLATISACTHEYIPDEKASWNVQVSLSFTDASYWPEGQQIRVGAFSTDDPKNPVASIGVSKPSGENILVAIGAVPEGTYQFKVYVTENATYKSDIVNLGEETVSSDLSLSKSGITLISFDRIQRQILNSCILCHGGSSGQLAANLNLMPGSSYTQLVDVPAYKNASFQRVKVGSGTYSYLVKVLNKDIDFDHAASSSATTADIQLIIDWINEGAKNN